MSSSARHCYSPRPLRPNKTQAGSARQTVWSQHVARKPPAVRQHTPPPTGRICVLPQRLIYPSRGRQQDTSRPASLTASCVFSQGYGSVSQPGGRAYQPPARAVGHRGTATSITASIKPSASWRSSLSSPWYRTKTPLSVGRLPGLAMRVMGASHAHTPAQPASRSRPDDLGGTELVRLSSGHGRITRHIQTRSCAVLCNWRFQCLAEPAHRTTKSNEVTGM